ncbi:hypothetical protein Ancab_031527 [Ancistrocladus abbreviatus]
MKWWGSFALDAVLAFLLQMSLYLGKLSSRIRKDELERVFRRFGRCTVQLKDGYGFAVYDLRLNAEKALRALKGRKICGEPISLTWSNKQPGPVQRFARGARSRQMRPRRKSAGYDFVDSNGHGDYRMSHQQLDDGVVKDNLTDIPDGGGRFNQAYSREEDHSQGEGLFNDGHDVERNLVGNDRWGEQDGNFSNDDDKWGEQDGNLSNDNHIDSGLVFDRYEPDISHERREEDKYQQITYCGGSLIWEASEDRVGRERVGDVAFNHSDPRTEQTCFKCGIAGHKMRDCQQDDSLQRRELHYSDHRWDKETHSRTGGGEPVGPEVKSWGTLGSNRRHGSSVTHHGTDKDSASGKHGRSRRRASPAAKELSKDKRKDSGVKRQSERESDTFEEQHDKRTRRSKSKSQSSMSRSANSKSRSRSSSPTSFSLSVSLGRPVLSPPNKAEVNVNDSFDNATSLLSKEALVEEKQHLEVVSCEESSKSEETLAPVPNNSLLPSMEEDDVKMDCLQRDTDNNHRTLCGGVLLSSSPEKRITAGKVYTENLGEHPELQDFRAGVNNLLEATKKSDSEALPDSRVVSSLSIFPEEFHQVLKHYGLKCPEESKRDLSVEDYFGSARFWPWEIIYYRRLKKGPVSTENYARRLAQNREFGITDKYIRSSSGWGELIQDRP